MDKVRRYYNTKKATAKHQGIPFVLELRDIHFLLFMARITVDQIGKSRGQYNLARLGDSGAYEIGNCRFITQSENLQERAMTPETREKMSESHKRDWATNSKRKEKLRISNSVNPRRKSKA